MAKQSETDKQTKTDEGQATDQSLAKGVIKIKLKKPWRGLRPGDSIKCTPDQLAKTGLKADDDYRYVGKYDKPTATTIEDLIHTR